MSSPYELERSKNIKERVELFKNYMVQLEEQKQKIRATLPSNNTICLQIRKRRVSREKWSCKRSMVRRSSPPRTRSRTNSLGGSSTPSSPIPFGDATRNSLIVKFPFNKSSVFDENEQAEVDIYEESDEEEEMPVRKMPRVQRNFNSSRASERIVLNPDDVTPRQLALVADSVSVKVYDPVQGTSCHQCRQKTKDTKTVCRYPTCFGVRGQFCGVCLRNRYGEDAREALMDPEWACPVCRDICNCSFCRPRRGLCPTGILVYQAKSLGYKSVKDYLTKIGE